MAVVPAPIGAPTQGAGKVSCADTVRHRVRVEIGRFDVDGDGSAQGEMIYACRIEGVRRDRSVRLTSLRHGCGFRSWLLRGPLRVLLSLADADVILERRDEENLVLMRAERFEAAAT